jgi:hypothetical protein
MQIIYFIGNVEACLPSCLFAQGQTQMMNGITSHCSHSVVPIVPTSFLVRIVLAVTSVNGGLKMPVAPDGEGKLDCLSPDRYSVSFVFQHTFPFTHGSFF